MSSPRIYTIGHSNLSADEFAARLAQHGIEALVDVRSAPFSHYTPHFNRDILPLILKEHGVEYSYGGEYLGGRPKDPALYKSGELPSVKANYLELVDYEKVAQQPYYKKGISRLLQIAGEKRTAIMCSEEDPTHCHRQHLITQSLLRQGIEVLHIRAHGLETAEEEPKQLNLF